MKMSDDCKRMMVNCIRNMLNKLMVNYMLNIMNLGNMLMKNLMMMLREKMLKKMNSGKCMKQIRVNYSRMMMKNRKYVMG